MFQAEKQLVQRPCATNMPALSEDQRGSQCVWSRENEGEVGVVSEGAELQGLVGHILSERESREGSEPVDEHALTSALPKVSRDFHFCRPTSHLFFHCADSVSLLTSYSHPPPSSPKHTGSWQFLF